MMMMDDGDGVCDEEVMLLFVHKKTHYHCTHCIDIKQTIHEVAKRRIDGLVLERVVLVLIRLAQHDADLRRRDNRK